MLDQRTLAALPGKNRRPTAASLQRRGTKVEAESRFLFLRTVAFEAMGFEERTNLGGEIDGHHLPRSQEGQAEDQRGHDHGWHGLPAHAFDGADFGLPW